MSSLNQASSSSFISKVIAGLSFIKNTIKSAWLSLCNFLSNIFFAKRKHESTINPVKVEQVIVKDEPPKTNTDELKHQVASIDLTVISSPLKKSVSTESTSTTDIQSVLGYLPGTNSDVNYPLNITNTPIDDMTSFESKSKCPNLVCLIGLYSALAVAITVTASIVCSNDNVSLKP